MAGDSPGKLCKLGVCSLLLSASMDYQYDSWITLPASTLPDASMQAPSRPQPPPLARAPELANGVPASTRPRAPSSPTYYPPLDGPPPALPHTTPPPGRQPTAILVGYTIPQSFVVSRRRSDNQRNPSFLAHGRFPPCDDAQPAPLGLGHGHASGSPLAS
ncbi:hypothetical protein MKEN_00304800 [Mycena kentingensis (nom. inval.)]|nr:hypothetical protein MKEN_00304800 [Mycena kentingensis (nom. inval.)]